MRCMVESPPLLIGLPIILYYYTPQIAGNLPIKLWLLGDGQQCYYILSKKKEKNQSNVNK